MGRDSVRWYGEHFSYFKLDIFSFDFALMDSFGCSCFRILFGSALTVPGLGRGSKLATVIDESPGRAIKRLAGREGHLTATIPVHRRVVQADPLRLKHLTHRVEVLLLAGVARGGGGRRRARQMAQVSARLVQVPRGEPALVGRRVVAGLLAAPAVTQGR